MGPAILSCGAKIVKIIEYKIEFSSFINFFQQLAVSIVAIGYPKYPLLF
jgi:hypothetical protein